MGGAVTKCAVCRKAPATIGAYCAPCLERENPSDEDLEAAARFAPPLRLCSRFLAPDHDTDTCPECVEGRRTEALNRGAHDARSTTTQGDDR